MQGSCQNNRRERKLSNRRDQEKLKHAQDTRFKSPTTDKKAMPDVGIVPGTLPSLRVSERQRVSTSLN